VDSYVRTVDKKILTNFHSDEYINLIQRVTPANKHLHEDQLYRCSLKAFFYFVPKKAWIRSVNLHFGYKSKTEQEFSKIFL